MVSLPESRRLSATPITMPLTGFAHLRTEKIRAKIRRKKWTGRSVIPRPCSAMVLPWPSGRVDNEARIQPGRAESDLRAQGKVAPARPWRRIGVLWGWRASCTGKRKIIGRLPLPGPQLYIRAYRLWAPLLPRPALAARSFSVSATGKGGTGCHLEQPRLPPSAKTRV